MAKRQSSLEGAKRAPRTGRAADFTRQAVGATRARRLSASQVATATLLGQFVEAAYAMFQANPGDPTPRPSPNFPAGYKLVAGIEMRDFIIGGTEHLFYGFIAQSTTAANQFVAAFRGTVGGVEWWDDFNSIVLTPFRVPGCGSVGAGFARIYNTIALVAYPSAAAPKTTLVERSLSSRGRAPRIATSPPWRRTPASIARANTAPWPRRVMSACPAAISTAISGAMSGGWRRCGAPGSLNAWTATAGPSPPTMRRGRLPMTPRRVA